MANNPPFWGVYKVKIERAEPHSRGRLIALSDIHGHYALLDDLLRRLDLQPEDTLVFVGDYIERGVVNLPVVRRVMELCEKRPRTWALLGNIDAHKVWQIDTDTDETRDDLWANVARFGGSLFFDMCRELGLPCASPEDVAAAKEPVRRAFARELAFLRGLPTILETPYCIFVHGGLPVDDLAALEGTEFYACAKFDRFLEITAPLRQPTVVGHWPACLYRSGVSDGSPYWSAEKNVLAIDGGCGLRYDAQLNAVWIDPSLPGFFRWTASCRFPQVQALDAQEGAPARAQFCWPRSRGRVLWRGGGVARIEQKDTGLVVDVPEPFVEEGDGEIFVNDCTDEVLAVEPGDRLWLIARIDQGAYVRKGGISGWYRGRFAPCERADEPWHGGV